MSKLLDSNKYPPPSLFSRFGSPKISRKVTFSVTVPEAWNSHTVATTDTLSPRNRESLVSVTHKIRHGCKTERLPWEKNLPKIHGRRETCPMRDQGLDKGILRRCSNARLTASPACRTACVSIVDRFIEFFLFREIALNCTFIEKTRLSATWRVKPRMALRFDYPAVNLNRHSVVPVAR